MSMAYVGSLQVDGRVRVGVRVGVRVRVRVRVRARAYAVCLRCASSGVPTLAPYPTLQVDGSVFDQAKTFSFQLGGGVRLLLRGSRAGFKA